MHARTSIFILIMMVAPVQGAIIHFVADSTNVTIPPVGVWDDTAVVLSQTNITSVPYNGLLIQPAHVSWHLQTTDPIREALLTGTIWRTGMSQTTYATIEVSPDNSHWAKILDTRLSLPATASLLRVDNTDSYLRDLWVRGTVAGSGFGMAGISLPLTLDVIAHAPEPSTLVLCIVCFLTILTCYINQLARK